MPGPPQARFGDTHVCTVPPAFVAPIVPPCSVNVLVNKIGAARMGLDMTATGPVPPAPPVPHPFVKGSATVLINKMPALRIGDLCSNGGPINLGSPNVLTGG